MRHHDSRLRSFSKGYIVPCGKCRTALFSLTMKSTDSRRTAKRFPSIHGLSVSVTCIVALSWFSSYWIELYYLKCGIGACLHDGVVIIWRGYGSQLGVSGIKAGFHEGFNVRSGSFLFKHCWTFPYTTTWPDGRSITTLPLWILLLPFLLLTLLLSRKRQKVASFPITLGAVTNDDRP